MGLWPSRIWIDSGILLWSSVEGAVWVHVICSLLDPSRWKPEMMIPVTPFSTLTRLERKKWCGEEQGNKKNMHQWFAGLTFNVSARGKKCVFLLLYVCWSLWLIKLKFYIINSHLDIQFWEPACSKPYHFEVKSQSLMESASFSHAEISFDSFPQTYVEKQHAHTVHWPIQAISSMEEACGLTCWGWDKEMYLFSRVETEFLSPLLAPTKGEPPPSLPMKKESKCHFLCDCE